VKTKLAIQNRGGDSRLSRVRGRRPPSGVLSQRRDRALLSTQAVNLDDLMNSYSFSARTEGKSEKTIAIYTTALRVLLDFLRRNKLPIQVDRIGVEEVRRFITYLQSSRAYQRHPFTKPQEKRLSGHTINCYLRAMRAFWSWAVSEEIVGHSPFDRVKIPKPPRKVIVPFTEEQVRDLLGAIDTRRPTGYRDWTIILTLLDTGIRVTELTGLRLPDANLKQRSLRVFGKGRKERMVPIGATLQRAIIKYASQCRPVPATPSIENLFLGAGGNPMTANGVEAIITKYGIKAGVEGVRCSPHTFRHTFALMYLRNGGDVFTLQHILGHETLDMVRNYVNVAEYDVEQAHLRCSPADNMRLRASSRRNSGPSGVQLAKSSDEQPTDRRLASKYLRRTATRLGKRQSAARNHECDNRTEQDTGQKEKGQHHTELRTRMERTTGRSNALARRTIRMKKSTDSVESQQPDAWAAKFAQLQKTIIRLESKAAESDRMAAQVQRLQKHLDEAEQAVNASRCPSCGNLVAWDRLPVEEHPESALREGDRTFFGLFNRRGKRCPICRYFEEAKTK
jgi:site-specific recombinase XerD